MKIIIYWAMIIAGMIIAGYNLYVMIIFGWDLIHKAPLSPIDDLSATIIICGVIGVAFMLYGLRGASLGIRTEE